MRNFPTRPFATIAHTIRYFGISLAVFLFAACKPSASEYLANGKDKMKEGRLQEALSLIDEAIKLSPQNADAFNARGVAHFQLKENSKALANFDKALELDSADYRYYFNRGNVKRRLNIVQGALEDYSKAIALDDQHYDIYLNRGIVLLSMLNLSDALDDLNKSVALNSSGDLNPHFYRGQALLRTQQFAGAEQDFRTYLAENRENGEAFYYLALALTGQRGGADEEICGLLARGADKGHAPAREQFKGFCQ